MKNSENELNVINEISEKIHKFNNEFDSYITVIKYREFDSEEDRRDYLIDYEERLMSTSHEIYYLFIQLFDYTKSEYMYKLFQEEINDRYKKYDEITKGTYIDAADDIFSDLSGDYWKFLKPYKINYKGKDEENIGNISTQINVLEKLLEETNLLCKLSKAQITNEPSVYNTVKQYLYILFPQANNVSGQTFPSTAKVYKPDIIVPECNAVIEYKYIDNESKISSTIAGIADDVTGYKEDTNYRLFYAVFYFTEAFCSKDRFDEIWKEKKFPKNWKAYYIVATK